MEAEAKVGKYDAAWTPPALTPVPKAKPKRPLWRRRPEVSAVAATALLTLAIAWNSGIPVPAFLLFLFLTIAGAIVNVETRS